MAPSQSALTFSDVGGYQTVEGVVFSSITVAYIGLCIVAGSILCFCFRQDLKLLTHTFLTVMFPELITKNIYMHVVKHDKGEELMVIALEEEGTDQSGDEACATDQDDLKEVHLFADKELNIPPGRFHSFLHIYTYVYFIVAAILAFLWCITFTVEGALYRKTGTCNDINVLDNSFTCFDLGNRSRQINCDIGRSPNITVFCYLYSLNPAAIGIGFSIFKLIIFLVTVYFKIVVKIGEVATGRRCGCCTCPMLLFIAQIVLSILSAVALTVLIPLHITEILVIYFFHGNAAIRVATFMVLYVTIPVILMVPWCGFTGKNIYRNMVLDPTLPRHGDHCRVLGSSKKLKPLENRMELKPLENTTELKPVENTVELKPVENTTEL